MAKELAIVIKEKSSVTKETGKGTGKGVGIGALLKPLIAIGIGVTLLADILKPILTLLKYILAIVLIPILDGIFSIAKKMGILEFSKYFKEGTEEHGQMQDLVGQMKDGWQTFKEDPEEAVRNLKEFSEKLKLMDNDLSYFLGRVTGAFAFFLSIFVGIENFFKNLGTIWDGVKESFKEEWAKVSAEWNNIKIELAKVWTQLRAEWDTIKEGLAKVWPRLKREWDDLKEGVKNIWPRLKEEWDLLRSGLANVWPGLKGVWDTIVSGLNTIWTNLSSAFNGLINGIRNVINRIPFIGGGKAFGGTVAKDGLYPLHAGETVTTKDGSSSGGNVFNINITGNFNQNEIIRKLTSEIQRRVGI